MNILNFLLQIVLLVVGFFLLIKGADWFVEGASKIADRFNIPQIIIGLTIVAFGTSAPEAAISITAALNNNADITIGNVVGSNIFNILVILGITACIKPLLIQKSTLRYELPFVVITTAVLWVLGMNDGQIDFIDGLIMWALFLVFLGYLILQSKKGEAAIEEIEHADKKDSMLKLLLMTAIGMAAIAIGSDVTVDSATNIATTLHMSQRLIALTIVAFGTSLPELITSITAAKKGNSDIAIGNIVGSNIFNILFVAGTTALISTVPFAPQFGIDTIIAVISAILLWLFVFKDHTLEKKGGIIMLVCYAAYFVYLVIR